MRPSKRQVDEMRLVSIQTNFTSHAEGSVLISMGNTKVICTASIDAGVPGFMKGQGKGWVTAEYGMLPRSTGTRMRREATQGKQSGRTMEIQRLIGRALRTVVNRKLLGENTIYIDCDVIQADGGTRTAAITGAYVAMVCGIKKKLAAKYLTADPVIAQLAAISVGMYQDQPVLDLDYAEDSNAESDMNVVMNDALEYVEVQGTAEGKTFSRTDLNTMFDLAESGVKQLFLEQQKAIADYDVS